MERHVLPYAVRDLQLRAWRTAERHGWHEPGEEGHAHTVGDRLALIHSEVSEALEAYRSRGFQRWTREDGKPEGVGPELADVVIRVLDMCQEHHIDLSYELAKKMAYNETRPYRHGGKRL